MQGLSFDHHLTSATVVDVAPQTTRVENNTDEHNFVKHIEGAMVLTLHNHGHVSFVFYRH